MEAATAAPEHIEPAAVYAAFIRFLNACIKCVKSLIEIVLDFVKFSWGAPESKPSLSVLDFRD